MNKLMITIAAVSAMATPAFAESGAQPGYNSQPYNGQQNGYRGGYGDGNMSARIGQLQMRLDAGVQSGSIDRREAMQLRRGLRQLSMLERQYSRDGLSGQERADLQRRMRDIRMAIRNADGNDQARWNDYDRQDGYSGGGQWSGSEDGRYQQQQPARSGLDRVIDGVLGRDGLRVGQRVSGDLYSLQGGYRDQFRDDGDTYFRTDGRQIYQIDARSQTVVRIYPMNR